MRLEKNKSHRGLLITGIVDMVIFFVGFIFPFFYWGDGFDPQWVANLIAACILLIGLIVFVIFYITSFFILKKQAIESANEDFNFSEIRFTPFPWVYLIFISAIFIGGLIFCGVNSFKNHELMKNFGFLLLLAFFTLIPTWVYALRKNAKALLWNGLLYLPTLVWSVCVFAFCLFVLGIFWIVAHSADPRLMIKFWNYGPESQSWSYRYILYSILFFYYLIILNLYCLRSKRVQEYFENTKNSTF